MQHVNLKEKWRVDYPWLRTDTDMFCAMCQDTRQKNGLMRGSRNYQATAVFEHSISQAHTKAVASVAKQPSMKGHFDAACAKENDCILAQLAPFFL